VVMSTGVASISSDADSAYKVHGWLMFVAWGVFVPAGVLSARWLKGLKPGLWLKLHQAFNALAMLLMIIGLAIIINKTEDEGLEHFHQTHTVTGIVAIALAVLQPLNGFLRPPKPEDPSEMASTPRRVWEVSHRVVGVTAEVLAVITLFSGVHEIARRGLSESKEDKLRVGLIVWVAALAAAVAAREAVTLLRPSPPPGAGEDAEMAVNKGPQPATVG